jgi:hypothetical protein
MSRTQNVNYLNQELLFSCEQKFPLKCVSAEQIRFTKYVHSFCIPSELSVSLFIKTAFLLIDNVL